MSMFCYQCEQTAQGTGCTKAGVCGKDAETATLQDLLLYFTEGLAMYAHRLRQLGVRDRQYDLAVIETLFTTVTNVNFDPARLESMIRKVAGLRDVARGAYAAACKQAGQTPETLGEPAHLVPAASRGDMLQQGEQIGIQRRLSARSQDLVGLEELITYGLKGMAAYADHALILGQEDEAVYAFFHEALDTLARPDLKTDELLALALRVGEVNIRVMELLDAANTGAYGHPGTHPGAHPPAQGQGHPGVRTTSGILDAAASRPRGQGDSRVHPWRDAAGPGSHPG